MNFQLKHISVDDNWIHVVGIGRVGLYSSSDKAILLDYSMKWIVGANERIPVNSPSEIKEKILQLFKK